MEYQKLDTKNQLQSAFNRSGHNVQDLKEENKKADRMKLDKKMKKSLKEKAATKKRDPRQKGTR